MGRVIPVLLLLISVLASGCGDPSGVLASHQAALESGEVAEAERVLRAGLEDHPEDVPLLLAAGNFYLRPEPPKGYKPRLALHYALRADQAARGSNPEAALLLGKAHRAAGGLTSLPEGEALLAAGLEQVNHPDAEQPRRLKPFDPDLLEPTLPNILEQRRRWKEGRVRPTCPEEQLLVDSGRYPLSTGAPDAAVQVQTFVEVSAFCVFRQPASDASCQGEGQRGCSGEEDAVIRGVVAPMLWGAASTERCCADVVLARVKPD